MSIVMLYIVILYVRLRVWWTTAVWGGMGLIILLMDILLLPRIGISGAALSQLISSIVGAAFVVSLNWRLFRRTFRPVWIPQTGSALLSVWLLAHFWPTSTPSIGKSLFQIAAGAVVFTLALLLTRYMRVRELLELRSALSHASV
jgi:hypothetical protein